MEQKKNGFLFSRKKEKKIHFWNKEQRKERVTIVHKERGNKKVPIEKELSQHYPDQRKLFRQMVKKLTVVILKLD